MTPNKPRFQRGKRTWSLLVLLLLLFASACSTYQSEEDSPSGESESAEGDSDSPEAEEDGLSQEDPEEETTSSESGLTFHGYLCRVDCSGHEAGYEWAEENGITDPDDCGGNSESFIEGCRAYAGEEGQNGGVMDEEDSPDMEESDDEEGGRVTSRRARAICLSAESSPDGS